MDQAADLWEAEQDRWRGLVELALEAEQAAALEAEEAMAQSEQAPEPELEESVEFDETQGGDEEEGAEHQMALAVGARLQPLAAVLCGSRDAKPADVAEWLCRITTAMALDMEALSEGQPQALDEGMAREARINNLENLVSLAGLDPWDDVDANGPLGLLSEEHVRDIVV